MGIVEESWVMLSNLFRLVKDEELYRVADERLAEGVRDMVMYADDAIPTGVAHYTSWENLLRMLETQSGEYPMLRMYNYEKANDPEEGKIIPPEWKDLNKRVNELFEEHDPGGNEARVGNTYACSFSTKDQNVGDDLTFWRLYGNDGEGASLKLGTLAPRMHRIRYRDERGDQRNEHEAKEDGKIAEQMTELVEFGIGIVNTTPEAHIAEMGKSIAKALRQVLDGYFYLVKSRAYEQEREWRMIKVRPERNDVKYDVREGVVHRYIEGGKLRDLFKSASEITLGPKVENRHAARDYIEYLVRKHGMKYTKVKVSSQRYR